ncbi:MAG TPA: flagellar motor switch protein FliM [Candidatus Latescibacteria bacterium]|nr:flagellar motor switch protein FliM [Candidatus Latescibacterota bacterium]
MPKVLTQQEIDALFSVITSGELVAARGTEKGTKRTIRIYDWRHPDRVSKEQLHVLENLHGNFARHLGSTLSTLQRNITEVKFVSVAQLTYSEFISSLPDPSCSLVFSLKSLEGLGVIDFSLSIVFSLVDRLFGGKGEVFNLERELTTIEKNVMFKVGTRVLDDLQKTWSQLTSLKMKLERVETNPRFIQAVSPNEMVILFSFEAKSEQASGFLNLCYPYMTLEPIVVTLKRQRWLRSLKDQDQKTDLKHREKLLREVYVTLKVRSGETDVTMRDLVDLEVGDVLRLDTKAGSDVVVYVEETPKFLARPGVSGKNRAVQIVSPIEEGGEDENGNGTD